MLLISTDTDPIDSQLTAYARTFAAQVGTSITPRWPPATTAPRIQQELAGNPSTIFFFFGHGKRGSGLVGQCGGVAVDSSNCLTLLANRTTVLTCCHGDAIGPASASAGATTLGYVGQLAVPLQAPHNAMMEPAALRGPLLVSGGATPKSAQGPAGQGYRRLARQLHTRNRRWDRFIAGFMLSNARRVQAW